MMLCPTCKGRGDVRVWSMGEIVWDDCQTCDATGKLYWKDGRMKFSEAETRLLAMVARAKDAGYDDAFGTANATSYGRCKVYFSVSMTGEDALSEYFYADSIEECFDAARSHIAKLPSPIEARDQKFQADLAAMIERGKALGYDASENAMKSGAMDMLRGTLAALSENILTHQPETVAAE